MLTALLRNCYLLIACAAAVPLLRAEGEKWSFYQPDVEAGYNRQINALALDAVGNAYTCGWTGAANAHYDFMTAKHTAANGLQQWAKNAGYQKNTYDMGLALAVDGAGNATSAGFFTVEANGLNKDFRTIRYTTTGAVKWSKGLGGSFGADDSAKFVVMDSGGNPIVLGDTVNSSGLRDDLTLIKYSAAQGAVLWRKDTLHSANDSWSSSKLLLDGAGNPVVVAYAGADAFYLAKYSGSNGALLWEKNIHDDSTALDSVREAVLDPAGNLILFGPAFEVSSSTYAGFCTLKCDAATGSPIWEKTWRGPGFYGEQPGGVAADAAGNVIITGASDNTSGNSEIRTIKYAATDGAVLWNVLSAPSAGHNQEAKSNAIAVTAEGNVIITGSIVSPKGAPSIYEEDWDLFTVAYDGQTGYAYWERRWSGPIKGDEIPVRRGLKLAANGDVVIAGNAENWGSHATFLVSYANPGVMPPGDMVVANGNGAWPPVPIEEGTVLDFGKHLAGQRAELPLTVANTGAGILGNLSIEILGEHPSQFFISSKPSSILPNRALGLEVVFLPSFLGSPIEGTASYSGPRNAILRISASGEAPVEIPLKAEAMTPQDVYDTWAAAQGLGGDNTHADAIAHGDGVKNLLKFAFNMDASKADNRVLTPGGDSGLPAVSRVREGQTEYLQVQYVARFDYILNYRLKTATSLAPGTLQDASGWTASSTPINSTWWRVTQRKAIQAGTSKLFAVVEVTVRPPY